MRPPDRTRSFELEPSDDLDVRPLLARHLTSAILLFAVLATAARGFAPEEQLFEITAKDLADEAIELPALWKFAPGDDPARALVAFDDESWPLADTRLPAAERPEAWNGIGWFRLRIRVSPGLYGVPLALTLRQFGAAEVYLDGALLYSLGTVDARPEAAVPRLQRRPFLFSFEDHYRACARRAILQPRRGPGRDAPDKIGGFEWSRSVPANQRGLTDLCREPAQPWHALVALCSPAVFAAFAILHLLLYAFYREGQREPLLRSA